METKILAIVEETLSRVKGIEAHLKIQTEIIMSALDDLTAQVSANTAVEASAITLIRGSRLRFRPT